MNHHASRAGAEGFITNAAENLLKERAWHVEQIARIDAILEQMKVLAESKPGQTEKTAKRPAKIQKINEAPAAESAPAPAAKG